MAVSQVAKLFAGLAVRKGTGQDPHHLAREFAADAVSSIVNRATYGTGPAVLRVAALPTLCPTNSPSLPPHVLPFRTLPPQMQLQSQLASTQIQTSSNLDLGSLKAILDMPGEDALESDLAQHKQKHEQLQAKVTQLRMSRSNLSKLQSDMDVVRQNSQIARAAAKRLQPLEEEVRRLQEEARRCRVEGEQLTAWVEYLEGYKAEEAAMKGEVKRMKE